MLSNLVKVLSVFVIIAFSSGLALANKVGLDNVATRAWTDRDSNSVGLNTQICFRSTIVNNRKQKSNCVRLKSSISGVKQYEHIIFETKNTQFNFKTNNRSGTNIKFWLKERANEDTISLYSFLNQLNKAEIALVGAMCKKITEMTWLTTTVRRAVDRSNDIDPYVINRFKSAGYQDINRIAKRCQAAVEQKIGKIELVKFAASKVSKKPKECEYSKNKLYDMQSTLGYLDIYKSKVDGRYGPGTKKAIKIGKNKIFQFANHSSDCLSANELSWLKLLVSVKRKGQECKKFNSLEELKEVARLLERIGRPVFSPFSAFDRVRYSDHDYRQVVYAIIEYENSLSDDYFKVAQRDRDCRIITLEKIGLVEKAENDLSNKKDSQSTKLSEGNKVKDKLKEKKAEEELAKKKAEEDLAKKKAEEELAKKKEEIKRKKIEDYKKESPLMLADIKNFMKLNDDLDVVKIGNLFINFQKAANKMWDEKAIASYEELKDYVTKSKKFVSFREKKIDGRKQERERELTKTLNELIQRQSSLKNYISNNLGSKDVPNALALVEKITSAKKDDIKNLKKILKDVKDWMFLMDIEQEEMIFPLADGEKLTDGGESKNVERTRKKSDQLYKNDEVKVKYTVKKLTKEVGDGFDNFEVEKNEYLLPIIFEEIIIPKDEKYSINAQILLSDGQIYSINEEASEALASQEGLGFFLKNDLKITKVKNIAGAFIVPIQVITASQVILRVFVDEKKVIEDNLLDGPNKDVFKER